MADSRILVLLGMHRSGTSLAASILDAMGVDFGNDFIAANENNPKGYFEDAAISRVHIRINRLLDRRPFTPTGLIDYPASFWSSSQANECVDELEMLVRKRLDRTDGIWGFKDPHTIKFLPLWKKLFERTGVKPVYILAVRHPSEVAASTLKRDKIEAGQGELLWVDQNVSALHCTDFNISAVIDYAMWFSDPLIQVHRLNDVLGLAGDVNGAGPEAILGKIIDPGLRHLAHAGDAQLPIAGELYMQLVSAMNGADLEAATGLLVQRYRSAKSLFGPVFDILEREHLLRLKRKQELDILQEKSQQEIRGLRNRLDKLETLTKSFMESRTGVLARQYQIYRRRIMMRDPKYALLVQLQQLVNKGG